MVRGGTLASACRSCCSAPSCRHAPQGHRSSRPVVPTVPVRRWQGREWQAKAGEHGVLLPSDPRAWCSGGQRRPSRRGRPCARHFLRFPGCACPGPWRRGGGVSVAHSSAAPPMASRAGDSRSPPRTLWWPQTSKDPPLRGSPPPDRASPGAKPAALGPAGTLLWPAACRGGRGVCSPGAGPGFEAREWELPVALQGLPVGAGIPGAGGGRYWPKLSPDI